jgi:hypothetical protein
MRIEIAEESAALLAEYARVPIAFEIRSVFDVSARSEDSGDFILSERVVATPTIKDFDLTAERPGRL